MAVKLITYDLNGPGQDYAGLYERIKALGSWLHLVDSTWLVVTNKSTSEVTDAVRAGADSNDHFYVVDISGAYSNGWLPKASWDWINAHVPAPA